jgi:hypothetical protein
MALRKREKRTERSKLDATPPWETKHRDQPKPTTGPYDERDAPAEDVARIDLGAMLIPATPGIDVRLDVAEDQQVVSATLVTPFGQMQLGVFAAPRNDGIWDEVRAEIKDSVAAQSGSVRDASDGPFGTELVGKLKMDGVLTPVRFIGVDGPRWFLRAMLVGVAASEAARAAPFENVLREIVVVRGADPLPVREPVPLRLPKQAETDGEVVAGGSAEQTQAG